MHLSSKCFHLKPLKNLKRNSWLIFILRNKLSNNFHNLLLIFCQTFVNINQSLPSFIVAALLLLTNKLKLLEVNLIGGHLNYCKLKTNKTLRRNQTRKPVMIKTSDQSYSRHFRQLAQNLQILHVSQRNPVYIVQKQNHIRVFLLI